MILATPGSLVFPRSTSFSSKELSDSAICVRGNASNHPNHFTESIRHSDAVVTDSLTGLVWQKAAATDSTWEEALAYCEASTAAGTGDWRLPTKKTWLTCGLYHLNAI